MLESQFWIEFHSDDGTSFVNEAVLVELTMQQYLIKFVARSTQFTMDYQFDMTSFILGNGGASSMSDESLTAESTTRNGQTLVNVMLLIPPLGN